jgi:hypothetical protein
MILEDDLVSIWIIVIREASNQFAGLDLQGVGPHKVTIWRDTTSPVLKLRYESVELDPHFVG